MDEDDVVHLDEGGQEDHLRGQPAGQVDGGDDDEWVGNDSGMTLLDFERDTLTSTLPDSVLFVVANGLGIERLFLEHLVLFSDRRLLAIVLNTTPHDENYLIGKMKEMNLGCEPKIINADVNTKDREAVYLEGGVQFCSTRVVLVDLLQSRLPVGRVAAILVYRAHNVLTSFQESFVLRLYREKKADGLVKAFTDVPSSLSSIGQLQRLVNRLYVKHVKLIPRFSFDVEHELSQCQLRSAVFSVDVSQSMRRVHRTLLDLIKVCVRDLRACSTTGKQAPNEPVEEISQVPYNVTFLERKLKERRSFMTDKQVRLVADSALLRELLQMAESLDAATVLNKLLVLKSDRQMIEESSGWLMSPTAGRMVEDLQTLCGGSGGFAKFITPPKWDVLVDVLNEVKQIPVDEKELPEHGPSVLVMANAEDVCRQLLDVVRHGLQKAKWMCWRQLGRPCDSPTPPDEPLWPPEHVSLFTRSQLGMRPDARSEMVANVQKAQKAVARATQKKRKAAENLIGRFNSKIQTTIVQFGILHYKRRKTQLASSEVEVKEEAPDEDEQVPTTSAAAHATVKTIGEYDNVELVVMPQGERYSTMKFLEQRKPTVIILYTMSLLSMRQIEIYRACHPNLHLQVYCMQYRDSTEEGRYLESMNRETIAFESLIREQGTLLIPRQFDVQREDAPRIKPSTRDGGGQAAATSSTVDDADATPADVERPKVIVDMREFNSELPTVLYTKGFDVVAATLEVGDYVLSSSIAVERKALDDLAQSLQSGRVFKQIEQMLEHYANTILLVESNQKFELKIVNGGPFQGELSRHCREIRARLCTLIRTQPRLKCVWAMSPMNSAEFFAELKLNSDEPDLLTAVSLRGDHVAQEANEADRPSTSGNKKRKVNNTIQRALTTHLDMKVGDAQRLLTAGKINTLAELFSSNTSTKKLEENLPASQVDFIKILATFDFSARR